MIPGSNLLRSALRLIKPTQILYLQATGRTQNAVKQFVATFADPVPLMASVQAVNRDTYNELGLDFQKNYIKVFASKNIVDLGRDTSGDRLIFNGKLYQIESQVDWFVMDGWASCLAVYVSPAP